MIALQKEVGQIPGILKIHLFVPEKCRLKITKQYFYPKSIEILIFQDMSPLLGVGSLSYRLEIWLESGEDGEVVQQYFVVKPKNCKKKNFF